MQIRSIQKVIKVGSSLAVTIPARDAKVLGIQAGDNIAASYEPLATVAQAPNSVQDEYQAFKKQYHETLKNLADR